MSSTTASVDLRIRSIDAGSAPGSTCSTELVEGPWAYDEHTLGYGPGASQSDALPGLSPRQDAAPAALPGRHARAARRLDP